MIQFPKIEQLLFNHTSEATAYVVNDYPYGFSLRCKIRYWIETDDKKSKGDRFCSQTTNPKVAKEVWNKPKKSTYCNGCVIMYLNHVGHVQGLWINLRDERDFASQMNFLISIESQLSKQQIEKVRLWYYLNTRINHQFRKDYYGEERQAEFQQWTKDTMKHILACKFSELLKHPQAPKRDIEEDLTAPFYIGEPAVAV